MRYIFLIVFFQGIIIYLLQLPMPSVSVSDLKHFF